MRHSRISVAIAHRAIRVTVAMALVSGATWSHAADPKASKFFEDALVRYDKKDMDGAIIQLKNALQIDPTMLPVQVLLGKALLRNGDVAAAEVALLEAIRLGVNRAEVVIPLSQAYLAQGKQKLIFERQQLLLPGLPPAVQLQLLLVRASAASDLGDARGALKAIDDARAIDPKSPEVWLAEVPIRIRSRQFSEASAAVERGLVLVPGSAEAWYQKGSVLHVMGQLGGALAAYDKALAVDASHAEARIARTGIYIDLGQPAEASKDLDALLKLAPREPRAAYLRALLAERTKNFTAANAALKEVTDLIDPVPMDFIRYRPQLLMLNGLSHFGLGQREKAKQYLAAFQRIQGNSPASKLLAQILLAEPNVPAAIDVLEGYLKGQPADAQAMTLLASAYMSLGRNAKATALMQAALTGRDTPEMRTVLGMSLIRGGQSVEGVTELDAVFRKTPGQTQAGLTLIGMYLRSGQSAKATSVAESLVKQFPQNASFFNLLGMARGQAGNGAAAKAAFEQALKLDDNLIAAKLNLARLEIATNAYDAASARLVAILKTDEKNAEAMYEMSVISDRRGKSADAQRWLEKANDLSGPKELRWGLALLDFFLRKGQPDLALQAAKRLSSKAPDDLQVLMAYARAQLAIGDPIGAKSSLNNATRFADYDAPKQVEIALLQLAANNLDGAAYSLDKALSGQPDFLPAMALMADIELRKNDPAKSEKRARDIVATYPQRAVGYSLLGDVARSRGQTAAAIENYRRAHQTEATTETLLRLFGALSLQERGKPAIQLAEPWIKAHPKDIVVQKAVGDIYARTGDYLSARSSYENVLKLAPDDSNVLNNLANVLLRLKDPTAIKIAEQALAKNPSNANAIDTLGWILFQNGQVERALTMLRDARLRVPANQEIRYHLAVVLEQTGRKNEARDELEAALKGGSSFEFADAAQALLRTLK
jgi:putative PEP-CTERM system TPR-repeat lipoprotein